VASAGKSGSMAAALHIMLVKTARAALSRGAP
jgi:hypothetical protein